MILKESTQCREMGNKIKALGCIERKQPKDSSLTYLIPRMGNEKLCQNLNAACRGWLIFP
jgi:hypothetical protein